MLSSQKDWFYRLIQGVMELGLAPDPLTATIALIPVDFLAHSIVYTSQCIAEQGNNMFTVEPLLNFNGYFGTA